MYVIINIYRQIASLWNENCFYVALTAHYNNQLQYDKFSDF